MSKKVFQDGFVKDYFNSETPSIKFNMKLLI